MKRISLILLSGVFSLLVAYANNNISTESKKDNSCLQDGYESPNPAPFQNTHLYVKHRYLNHQTGGFRAVTTTPVGSAGNLFTILAGEVNRITINNTLETVVFIHRTNLVAFRI